MKKIFTSLLVFLALGASIFSCSQKADIKEFRIIPYPQNIEVQRGHYNLTAETEVYCSDTTLLSDAQIFIEDLNKIGKSGKLVQEKISKGVNIKIDQSLDNPEAYKMNIGSSKVDIIGGGSAGVFYGLQTLLQQMKTGIVPCGTIEDCPRYSWRGFMLDEARHFSGKDRVKEILDLMSYYKMNRFHWHLTDAQGWRIEIKAYPKLSTVGGIGTHSDPDAPAAYYTQDEIREIVAYAKARHIEIIPEVDMPGHATAANKAYPEFNGGGTKDHPDFTFNVGKEETYSYLTTILREVASLFPYDYIHIGGDEVAYGSEAWKTDSYVLDLMKREHLKNVKEAERYFMNRMIDSVIVIGKKVCGWDELMDLNVDKDNSLIMWWRHNLPDYLLKALNEGYTTVICPRKPLYFDFVQNECHNVGRKWDGFCPIEDVYSFPDTLFNSMKLTDEQLSHIIGLQANAWSELLHTKQRVDFMIFPRLCGVAESGWTLPQSKSWISFESRLDDAYSLFDEMNIYYYDYRDSLHHREPAGPIIKKK